MFRLSEHDLQYIEDAFGVGRDGPWNRTALSFVGLSFPLDADWRMRLLRDGAACDAPVAEGIDPHAWRWLHRDADDADDLKKVSKNVDPHQYVMLRVDTVEAMINDLRAQLDRMKKEVRELRDMISKDEW